MVKNIELLGISALVTAFWGGMATLCRLLFNFSGFIVIGFMGITFILVYGLLRSIQGVDN